MLETREARARVRVQVALDLDDRRHGLLGQPEELQAHGARVRRHAVQNEARRHDDPVGTLLLHAR